MATIHVPEHYDYDDEPYFERLRHNRHDTPASFPFGPHTARRKRRKAARIVARDVRSAKAVIEQRRAS